MCLAYFGGIGLLQQGCTPSRFLSHTWPPQRPAGPAGHQYPAISNFPGTPFRHPSIEILSHEQLSLASLISHLPQTLWGRAGSCGFCYAFALSNLICFVFCCVPLERVKMLPHCGRTVLLYALTVMRQPGRLKRSHPVPYPRWREKKKQKTKKCPDRAGFVHEPRVEPGLERIPLFWGCVMSRF